MSHFEMAKNRKRLQQSHTHRMHKLPSPWQRVKQAVAQSSRISFIFFSAQFTTTEVLQSLIIDFWSEMQQETTMTLMCALPF